MLSEMPSRHLGVGGVPPLHLAESNQHVAQVGGVKGSARIVVWEMAYLAPLWSRLDNRNCGIREPPDVLSGPLRCLGLGCNQHQQPHQA